MSRKLTTEERAALTETLNDTDPVLAEIAEMSDTDRAVAERVHAIVRMAAPGLAPRTWYGMPAYAKDGKVVCFPGAANFKAPTRRSASATRRTSTRAPRGRPRSR